MYGVSQLAKSEDLKFFYKGMTYAYGITESGNEVIALIDQNNGDYIDILSGAGKPALRNKNNLDLVSVSGIKDFERSMSIIGVIFLRGGFYLRRCIRKAAVVLFPVKGYIIGRYILASAAL